VGLDFGVPKKQNKRWSNLRKIYKKCLRSTNISHKGTNRYSKMHWVKWWMNRIARRWRDVRNGDNLIMDLLRSIYIVNHLIVTILDVLGPKDDYYVW